MVIVRILFLFLLLAYSQSLYSQKGISSKSTLSSLTMDQWTSKEGLISNNLTSVFQASDKFIWVTNFNGFLRFDGVNFKFYDKTTLPYLSTSSFYSTFEDSKGNLWFTSQSSGILKLKNHEFSLILPEGKNSLSVRCIAEDLEGNLWVGTNAEGVYIYKDSTLQELENRELSMVSIMDIIADSDGNMWIATNGNGLYKYSGGIIKNFTTADGLPHNTVNKLKKDAEGIIYGGTLKGIFTIHPKDEIRKNSRLQNLEINDILFDDLHNAWIATEQGLYRYGLENNELDSLTDANGLPASQVSSLYFDHENSLWVATKKAGLLRLRDGFFENFSVNEGLSSNNVNIIVPHNGRLYVGTDDGIINIVERGKSTYFDNAASHRKQGIRDILFDGQDMYVVSYHGLSRISDGRETSIDFTQYGGTNDIRRIYRSRTGDLWMATRSGGVIKYNKKEQVTVYNLGNGLKSEYILAIEEGKNGEIYVGTHSGGLSVINPNGKIDNFPIEEGKSGILIFNVEVQPDNTLLAATNVGLYKFDNQIFKKIHLNPAIKAETFFDVVTDAEWAWISTNIGLLRLNLEDIERNYQDKIEAVDGKMFDRFDGMPSNECTGATRMTPGSNGQLYIPTLGGVAILHAADIRENTSVPSVFITELITDGVAKEISSEKVVQVEPGAMRFEILFTVLSYLAPQKVQFKYRLKGIDTDWVDGTADRSALYTNLAPGTYTFTVIGANNDGVWNSKGSSFKFHVKPYFYQTRVFAIGLMLLIALLVWGGITWRIRSVERVNAELRKLNEELDRFVYSASHDLRAPLSSVLGLVEIARLEKTLEGKETCLTMIRDSVQKLDGFIKDIIDYSRNQRLEVNAEKVNLKEIVDNAFQDLKFLDKDNFIHKNIICPADRHFITDGKRFSVVMKNLISNAIRYHDIKKEKRYINVEITYKADKAVIAITDNGIGIAAHHIDNIFKMFYRADESSSGSGLGLYIVKESIDKLKGTVEVRSEVDKGTTFTVTIPSLRPVA